MIHRGNGSPRTWLWLLDICFIHQYLTIKERRDFLSSVHSQRRWVHNIWYLRTTSQLVCFHFSFDYHLHHHRHFWQKQQMTIFAFLKEAHKRVLIFWCNYSGYLLFSVSHYFVINNNGSFVDSVVKVTFKRKHKKYIVLWWKNLWIVWRKMKKYFSQTFTHKTILNSFS